MDFDPSSPSPPNPSRRAAPQVPGNSSHCGPGFHNREEEEELIAGGEQRLDLSGVGGPPEANTRTGMYLLGP